MPVQYQRPKGVLVLTYPITREVLSKIADVQQRKILLLDNNYEIIGGNFYMENKISLEKYKDNINNSKIAKVKIDNEMVYANFLPIVDRTNNIIAYVGALKSSEAIDNLENSIKILLSLVIIGLIILLAGASWIMTQNIMNPIDRLIKGIKRVEKGEYIPLKDQELSREFEILRNNFNSMIEKISENFMEIKQRDEKLTHINKELKSIIMEKEKAYKLSITDGLTKLYNHRYFQEEMTSALFDMKKINKPLSMILLDIDFFKKFNDTYGHQVGDETLIRVAGYLTLTARKNDIVARYGGEEFAVILPGTNLKEAYIVAERMRNYIEIDSKKNIPITVSMGVACFPESFDRNVSENINEIKNSLINKADIALYYSKKKGRNKSSLYNNGFEEIDSDIKD